MRIACVMVPNFAVQLTLAADPSLQGQPLVIGGLPFELRPVCDASAEATACGVKVGMPLREAYAICPGAKFVPAEEWRYRQVFEVIADILERYSLAVDIEKPGCACIDIGAVRDEAGLCREIVRRIHAETGLRACLGVSSGRFFARTAAFTAPPEAPVIVSPGREIEFVAPFSVDFLPCSEESKGRLRLLGIRFIGELALFSKEALVAQFGSDGVVMHDLACGIDRCVLVPRQKPELLAESIRLDSPAVSAAEILHSCEAILRRLLPKVCGRGRLCRELTVRLDFASGTSQGRKLPLKEPAASTGPVLSRLRAWLETVRFPSGVTGVVLTLSLTGERGKTLPLWPDRKGADEGVLGAAERLKLRLGYQPIKRLKEISPRPILPEKRFTLTDVTE
jgi:nucleotidyltransferase/DNA polymerase involved in DNA repair